jgi:hypothetical protein
VRIGHAGVLGPGEHLDVTGDAGEVADDHVGLGLSATTDETLTPDAHHSHDG